MFLGALGLVATGVWVYLTYFRQNEFKAEDLIPRDAVLVYESKRTIPAWNRLSYTTFGKQLSKVSGYSNIGQRLAILDSITGRNGRLDDLLKKEPFYISTHVTSRDEFGFIFYLKSDPATDKILYQILSHYLKSSNAGSYNYRGIEIKRLNGKGGPFHYFTANGYFVGSYSSMLAEDVIRTMEDRERKPLSFMLGSRSMALSDARLHINPNRLPALLACFSEDEFLESPMEWASTIESDLKVTDRHLVMGGTVKTKPGAKNYLDTFEKAPNGTPEWSKLISNRTATLWTYAAPDYGRWRLATRTMEGPVPAGTDGKISVDFHLDQPEELSWLGTNHLLATLESVEADEHDRLVYAHCSDPKVGERYFRDLSKRVSSQKEPFLEKIGKYNIRHVNLGNLPAIFFGKRFSGFGDVFYCRIGDFIVMTDRLPVLRRSLRDIETENTWGKSVDKVRFMKELTPDENMGLIVDTKRFWNGFMRKVRPEWQAFFKDNAFSLRQIKHIAFGVRHDKQGVYQGSLVAEVAESNENSSQGREFNTLSKVSADTLRIKGPFILNSGGNGWDILSQTQDSLLRLVTRDDSELWAYPFNGTLVDSPVRVHTSGKKNTEYAMATSQSIYVMKRDGFPVDGFPIKVDSKYDLATFNVFDYDGKRDYRFIVSDTKGNIRFIDLGGSELKGWNPKKMRRRLLFAPKHIKVRRRDYILVALQNGEIHLFNRKGQEYKGFPVDLDAPMAKGFFLDEGSDYASTNLTFITLKGQLNTISLSGRRVRQEQYYKPDKHSFFELCPDVTGSSYLILRRDIKGLSVLDDEQNPLFEKGYINAPESQVKYYRFDADHEIIAVTDPVQEFIYLFDRKGNLISGVPLQGSSPVNLTYSQTRDKYKVYYHYRDELLVTEF
ncbi:hypothetical protein FUAX_35680 [Fulvitalea axinellae]|uniref:Uncharacterized protein n=1 Tax=Fulvitalea axinellae TaxID=1182444 RepID=A0AAU9CG72_9BACT|nr:hypothetical protein FUAX_35680 [Fulvitalea axinellae]